MPLGAGRDDIAADLRGAVGRRSGPDRDEAAPRDRAAARRTRRPMSWRRHFGSVACQPCTMLNGGGGLTGTANRKRAPSRVIAHSGIVLCTLNSRLAALGRN